MTKLHVAAEHEFEAQHGLPEKLPADERILWQGAPDWIALACSAFHGRKIAVWFALLLTWQAASGLHDGAALPVVLRGLGWPLALAALGLGLVLLLAWFTARTTAYTLTDKRVVMRVGIVLTVAYNLPLVRIEGAALHPAAAGAGDIALTLERDTRIAFLQLWPHVRPWQLKRPQPMLRALADAPAVAAQLSHAWRVATGAAAPVAPAPQRAPAPEPSLVGGMSPHHA
jgi:hypothetical protein